VLQSRAAARSSAAKGERTLVAKSKTTAGKSTGKSDGKSNERKPKDSAAKPKDSAAKSKDSAKPARVVDDAWVLERTRDMKGDAVPTGVPLSVFLGECIDCAKFLRTYWEGEVVDGKTVVPAMSSAAKAGDGEMSFGLHTADELVALHDRAQAAQTEYLLASKAAKGTDKLMSRGAHLLDQWTAALEWHFDDGVDDDRDAQLAAVRAVHEDSEDSVDAMASSLADFGGLAQKYITELTGVLDFDPSSIDEGLKLSVQLRASNAALERNPDERAALARRNNILALLHHRVTRVRKAAQLVFRGANADIARKVTSGYQRRARAAARRAKATDNAAKK
jgi:hypothetical protein